MDEGILVLHKVVKQDVIQSAVFSLRLVEALQVSYYKDKPFS